MGAEGVMENRATDVMARFWMTDPPELTNGDMRAMQASTAASHNARQETCPQSKPREQLRETLVTVMKG